MNSSFEILQHNASVLGAKVERHRGMGWLMLTKDGRYTEVWFTDTGKISRATTFTTPDDRKDLHGRHFRRQIMRWLRDGTRA